MTLKQRRSREGGNPVEKIILKTAVEPVIRRSYFDKLSTNGVLCAHRIGEAPVRPERGARHRSRRVTAVSTAVFRIIDWMPAPVSGYGAGCAGMTAIRFLQRLLKHIDNCFRRDSLVIEGLGVGILRFKP
ncbi:MAG: hypothetical protein ACT4NU_03635 [Chromatiales bacterium]